jgi:hypothetical protein
MTDQTRRGLWILAGVLVVFAMAGATVMAAFKPRQEPRPLPAPSPAEDS